MLIYNSKHGQRAKILRELSLGKSLLLFFGDFVKSEWGTGAIFPTRTDVTCQGLVSFVYLQSPKPSLGSSGE